MRLGLPVDLKKKKTQKLAVHAGGCAHDGGEKRNVLIVTVLLPIAVNFTLRSKTQRRIEVLWIRYHTFLLHVATAPKTVVGHGQIEDQASAARCVLEVAADLNVAAMLACACRYAVLRADRVSGRANNGPKTPTSSCALVAPEWAVQVLV